jgi:hypothetical protein
MFNFLPVNKEFLQVIEFVFHILESLSRRCHVVCGDMCQCNSFDAEICVVSCVNCVVYNIFYGSNECYIFAAMQLFSAIHCALNRLNYGRVID